MRRFEAVVAILLYCSGVNFIMALHVYFLEAPTMHSSLLNDKASALIHKIILKRKKKHRPHLRSQHIRMASFFVTGASRGFGLASVRDLASLPATQFRKVTASARGDAPALNELAQRSSGRVNVIQLDVTDQTSVKTAAAEAETVLGGKRLDVLINNAGFGQYTT